MERSILLWVKICICMPIRKRPSRTLRIPQKARRREDPHPPSSDVSNTLCGLEDLELVLPAAVQCLLLSLLGVRARLAQELQEIGRPLCDGAHDGVADERDSTRTGEIA